MQSGEAKVHFEQEGSSLTAVEIVRRGPAPVIVSLQRALLTLGIVVAGYQARPGSHGLLERVVLQRRDGGAIEGSLGAAARAAIVPLALQDGSSLTAP
jgi:hypothetical protein